MAKRAARHRIKSINMAARQAASKAAAARVTRGKDNGGNGGRREMEAGVNQAK